MAEQSFEPASHQTAQIIHESEYDLSLPANVQEAVHKLRDNANDTMMQTVREKLEEEFQIIKDDFPEIPQGHMESLASLVYGPFLYGRDLLLPTNDMMLRIQNASAQAAIMDGVLWASAPEADSRYANYIQTMIATSQEVAKNPASRIRGWLNGVKSGVAIIRALQTDGWKVTLPDYANNPREVLEWDINNYIDFIAEKDGKTLFIDAKARLQDEDGQTRRIASVEDRRLRAPYHRLGLPQSLNQYENALREGSVKHVNIILPSHADQLPDLIPSQDPKASLRNYGISTEQGEIVRKINELKW